MDLSFFFQVWPLCFTSQLSDLICMPWFSVLISIEEYFLTLHSYDSFPCVSVSFAFLFVITYHFLFHGSMAIAYNSVLCL